MRKWNTDTWEHTGIKAYEARARDKVEKKNKKRKGQCRTEQRHSGTAAQARMCVLSWHKWLNSEIVAINLIYIVHGCACVTKRTRKLWAIAPRKFPPGVLCRPYSRRLHAPVQCATCVFYAQIHARQIFPDFPFLHFLFLFRFVRHFPIFSTCVGVLFASLCTTSTYFTAGTQRLRVYRIQWDRIFPGFWINCHLIAHLNRLNRSRKMW